MDGYLRAVGVPVNLVTPSLNAGGALSRIAPIQFGGSAPVQIRALSGWEIPVPKQYLPEGIAAAAGALASGIEARAKRKQDLADKKAEREFKAEESKLDRESKERQREIDAETRKELAEVKARLKASSVTQRGESEASQLILQPSEAGETTVQGTLEGGEPPLPSQGGGASLGLIDGAPQPEQAAPRGLTGIPDQSAAQAARGVDFGKIADVGIKGFEDGKNRDVVGFAESTLDRGPVEDVVKAVPVAPQTAQGQPDATGQQTGILQDVQAPQIQSEASIVKGEPLGPQKQAPYGRGPMNEPSLLPPQLAKMPPYAVTYPSTFKTRDEYDRRKYWMDLDPRLDKTLAPNFAVVYNPKTGLLHATEKAYIPKDAKGKDLTPFQKLTTERLERKERTQNYKAAELMTQQNPFVKAYMLPTGPAQASDSLMSQYARATEASKLKTGNAGVADAAMIAIISKLDTGGKATQAENHIIENARSLRDQINQKILKPQSGAILSQSQRDAMAEQVVDVINEKAEKANEAIAKYRAIWRNERGFENEAALPEFVPGGKDPEVAMMLKVPAVKRIEQNIINVQRLEKALSSAPEDKQKEIRNQIETLKHESDVIEKRLRAAKEKNDRNPYLPALPPNDFHYQHLYRKWKARPPKFDSGDMRVLNAVQSEEGPEIVMPLGGETE
jgi:hypothetical protein